MPDKKREIARALVQLAWADGELTPEESVLLVKYLRQLGFDDESAHQAWLTETDPVNYEVIRELLPEAAERLELMRELLTISFSDENLSFSEFDLLEKMAGALEVTEEQMESLRTEVTSALDAERE